MRFHLNRTLFMTPFRGRDGGLGIGDFLLFWQGILAGLMVAGLCYAALMAAGLILGGEDTGMMLLNSRAHFRDLGAGNVLWIFLASVFSLFAGGYVGGRLSGNSLGGTVWIQSLVMAGIFLSLLALPASPNRQLSGQSTGFSAIVNGIYVYSDIHLWPELQNPVTRVFKREEFLYPYDWPIIAITSALVRGRDQIAINSAVRDTMLSAAEVERRLNSIKAEFQGNLQQAKAHAATMRMQIGFVLFGTSLLGVLLSILGGEWGRRASLSTSRRLSELEERERAAAA